MSVPYAIYADERMVGFIMYDFEPKNGTGYITRLMVDQKYQGNGYGREALQAVIGEISAISECRQIQISYNPRNAPAEKLYASVGFVKTGERAEDG